MKIFFKDFVNKIKYNYYIYRFYYLLFYLFPYYLLGEKRYSLLQIKLKWKKSHIKYKLNIDNPITLNEKIQWLKLNDKKPFYSFCVDKLTARKYWVDKVGGIDCLVPLIFQTDNWRDINYDILPSEPFIIKCSSGSNSYVIVRNKQNLNIKLLRNECRRWLSVNYYLLSQEWQYKYNHPTILIEKLLLDNKGKIPNDYKFHCMNGKVVFIYCAVDREGKNYRCIYSPNWKMMNFVWESSNSPSNLIIDEITKPVNLNKMIRISEKIAKDFKYVRVDFYEILGKLYYGEITLHHGSGYDAFNPEEWDYKFGKILNLRDN